ncbi:VanZ domain-containing protein [Rubrivivax sp. A210]|uniref:VanZ family protein n=1 Tax=Rubrivivax sp. A210 TaxID=2772301 RepID=UPI0019BE9892|nr:VanZ family protein [Rubrivivax sp. A210]CAD5373898.1 VanZ domain-containing protein [Rubrivivax sp. A210]
MPTLQVLLHDPAWRRPWRVLLLALLMAVSWLAFMPHPPDNQLPQGDKINHLLAFATLAAVACLGLTPARRQAVAAAAGLLAYGGFIELVQTQLPGRSGEWPDLLADGAGIALGLAAAAALRHLKRP